MRMSKGASEKIAEKIISVFNFADIDHHMVERIAMYVKNLAATPVLAKIIYFCERMLDEDD